MPVHFELDLSPTIFKGLPAREPESIAQKESAGREVQTLMKTMHNAGHVVGYQISGDGTVTSRTKIVFVTTGYLLQVQPVERIRHVF